ncbi:MAG TPA: S49 family peptidase, partial [Burkholderiaceae bacterium]
MNDDNKEVPADKLEQEAAALRAQAAAAQAASVQAQAHAADASQAAAAAAAASAEPRKEGWERDVLEKLALSTIREQRASRQWGIFFKFATLFVVLFALWHLFELGGTDMETLGRHTALIEVDGEIGEEGTGAASVVIPALNKAYADAGSVGIVVRVNSPGGSPVQAGMINDEMMRLRKLYPGKPLHVVVDEICASGGYYIAAGAENIYVNKASVIGSIGVLMEGFGFVDLMNKVGVERRLLTAGENKGFLDPYSPQSDKQKAFAQSMLNEIHQQF